MNAFGSYARLATPCYHLIAFHGAVAARDCPRRHRQEATAAQRLVSLLLDCCHLLTAVQPQTQNGHHLPFPFV